MKLRAGFMGSPEFAVPSLHAVARTCDLRVVVCQPDRPAGRGRKLTPPAVKGEAERLGLPLLQPVKMKDGTLAAGLAEHDLDLLVVVAFGRILPPAILTLPRHGCLNVHGSILPRWRGAAPIQRCILAGDRETGVSIMAMDEGLDTGDVHRITTTRIRPGETSGALFERLAQLGATALESFLTEFPQVDPPTPQDHGAATLAPPLRKEEGRTRWDLPAEQVVCHVLGMDPWPAAYADRGAERLKLFGVDVAPPPPPGTAPGTVLGVQAEGMRVATHRGSVWIHDVQPPGKRRMAALAYASGKPFAPGERLA